MPGFESAVRIDGDIRVYDRITSICTLIMCHDFWSLRNDLGRLFKVHSLGLN